MLVAVGVGVFFTIQSAAYEGDEIPEPVRVACEDLFQPVGAGDDDGPVYEVLDAAPPVLAERGPPLGPPRLVVGALSEDSRVELVDGDVVVSEHDSLDRWRAVALDGEVGSRLWGVELATSVEPEAVAGPDGALVRAWAGRRATVSVLDGRTGEVGACATVGTGLVEDHETPAVALDGGRIVVAALDDVHVVTLPAVDSERLVELEGMTVDALYAAGDTVIAGGHDGVVAVALDGTVRWRRTPESAPDGSVRSVRVVRSVGATDRTAVVRTGEPDDDPAIEGLDARTGEVRWSRSLPEQDWLSIRVMGDTVVALVGDELLGVDADNGELRWQVEASPDADLWAAAVASGRLLVPAGPDGLTVVDLATGAATAAFTAPDVAVWATAADDTAVAITFTTGTDRLVVAYQHTPRNETPGSPPAPAHQEAESEAVPEVVGLTSSPGPSRPAVVATAHTPASATAAKHVVVTTIPAVWPPVLS